MKLSEQYKLKNYKTDKNTVHSYIDYLYNDLVNQSYTNVLEIGAFDGGSALLWQDYFTKAKIDILDVNECLAIKNQPRINHIVGNAYSDELIKNLRTYDLIIDDGPHTLESMVYFIDNYIKLLKIDGIAVIEDVQLFQWFNTLVTRVPNNCLFHIVDLRNVKNRYDDLVLIIRRIR